jgi:transposase
VAGGNAVRGAPLLAERGVVVTDRTIQRAVVDLRRDQRATALATVWVETEPGFQLQIDFGQIRVCITGVAVRVFLLAAVLSYSRRLFVEAFLNERGDDWREGIAAAFRHFGGVPRVLLGDNARALVLGRDRATGTVQLSSRLPELLGDWNVRARACAPYRACTKGDT